MKLGQQEASSASARAILASGGQLWACKVALPGVRAAMQMS